ncbi:MAG: hypothetical protein M3Y22_17195, partial [Pseudomonadota bacterium]|nr:hypothetical protein [Pseudomonadota bacterium]
MREDIVSNSPWCFNRIETVEKGLREIGAADGWRRRHRRMSAYQAGAACRARSWRLYAAAAMLN